jgi:hypothetical protein
MVQRGEAGAVIRIGWAELSAVEWAYFAVRPLRRTCTDLKGMGAGWEEDWGREEGGKPGRR